MTAGTGRASDEERALSLTELQHRVRNTLATTRMIARRSAELSDNLEDYAAHLDGRLAALARVQNVILHNVAAGIDLNRLVTDELLSVLAYQDGRTRVEGPEVQLHLRAAEPVALVLHELATNAIKFGALNTSSGRLNVSWRIEEGEHEPRLVFDWIERGVCLDAHEPHRRGFGTEMLTEMVAYTLRAQASLAFASDGAYYRLVLPLTERVRHRA